MMIGKLTSNNVPLLRPETTLQEAALALREAGVPVAAIADHGSLVGAVGKHELGIVACAAGLDPATTPVIDICERSPAICPSDTGLASALALMHRHDTSWLLVRDRSGGIPGVLSLHALIDALIELVPQESTGPEPEYVHRVRGNP